MKNAVMLLLTFFLPMVPATAAVNVNTGTQQELETLNGIGAHEAKAIIDYREKHGHFKSINDLSEVPGISAATLAKIRNNVTLTANTKTATDIIPGPSASKPKPRRE